MGKSRSWGDDLYVQQMGRAMGGTLAAVALMLIAGDDDDDFLSFSGNTGNPSSSYKVKIFGHEVMDYRMLPELFMPIKFVQNWKAAQADPRNEKGAVSELKNFGNAYFGAAVSIKDMSFLDGVAKFLEAAGLASKAWAKAQKDGTGFDKAAKTTIGLMFKQHMGFALKPLLSNQSIVQNIERIASPAKEVAGDAAAALWYALGVQSFLNEKKYDILGNEVKALPGDDIIPMSGFAGLRDKDKELIRMLEREGVDNEAPENSFRAWEDKTSESGVTYRTMTPAEYTAAAKLMGELLRPDLQEYYDTQYQADRNQKFQTTTGTIKRRGAAAIEKMRTDAWAKAVKELYSNATLTQSELNEAIDQEGL